MTIEPTDILEFIKNFKEVDFLYKNNKELIPNIIYCFTQGNCYFFSLILSNIYKEGTIVYDQIMGHFLYKYKEKFYDIEGENKLTKLEHQVVWDTLQFTDELFYERLMRDCVYKICDKNKTVEKEGE
jgi:hypothetical protein